MRPISGQAVPYLRNRKGKCMNKKLVALLLSVGMMALLGACGGGGTAPADSPAAAPESPATSPSP
jgi:hypothetical protein